MVTHLYERFLKDPTVYADSETHWRELAERVATSIGQPNEWVHWIPDHFVNGTPMDRDGNPICHGRSHRLNRAFQIAQASAGRDEVEIAAWVKTYDEEFTEFPADQLFIHLSASEETSRVVEELLRKWMTPGTSVDQMRLFIQSVLPDDEPAEVRD